jgi:hypothetical protein
VAGTLVVYFFSSPTSPLTGTPKIVDTATLSLGGQHISLAGLVAVSRPEAITSAQAYLDHTGEVTCEISTTGFWHCRSLNKGLDIAEVFVLSGYAKAASSAPADILHAEGQARQNRRGIWGAS